MRAKFGRGPTVVSKKGSIKFISKYNTNDTGYYRRMILGDTVTGYNESQHRLLSGHHKHKSQSLPQMSNQNYKAV